ncbi:hypothetical protein [Absidia glauca]|uniref:Cyclin-dependent kinases regulatory subunit n=1 Tax=Absidia glauca TaxID=4829 RepID=A0A168MLJ2_ABSGL|nr:hypothetical protein [Absidia glauca]
MRKGEDAAGPKQSASKQPGGPPNDSKQPKPRKQEEPVDPELEQIREQMHRDVLSYSEKIRYSEIYRDDEYQYRHITLPPEIAQYLPDKKLKILLLESEYRRLGVRISSGWEHYMIYQPEPNILLLRRSLETAKKASGERTMEDLDEEHRIYLEQKRQREKEAATEQAKNGAAPPPTTRRKLTQPTRSAVKREPQDG